MRKGQARLRLSFSLPKTSALGEENEANYCSFRRSHTPPVRLSASRIANNRFFMCSVPFFSSCRRFHLPHLCFDPLQGEFKPHGQRREQLVHHLLGPLADIQPSHKGQRSGYVFWRRDWRWLWPCCLILSTYLGTYANDTIIELRKQ